MNSETLDTGQTRTKTQISTLEPMPLRQTVNASEQANVNYNNTSAGSEQIDATDD